MYCQGAFGVQNLAALSVCLLSKFSMKPYHLRQQVDVITTSENTYIYDIIVTGLLSVQLLEFFQY